MALLTTPEERFEVVPDYDHEPAYLEVDVDPADGGDEPNPRMAYVDVDPVEPDAEETFLCLHGEPTWGFLYRKMIPGLRERGRVVVPDLLGFGRSDKYDRRGAYGYELHYDALADLIGTLDLANVTLICQDWGGILGLPYATRNPERFARLVPMNTGVPSGRQEMPEAWEEFRAFVERVEELPVGILIRNATATELTDDVVAAYEAPFHTEAAKAGAREFPDMVPRKGGGDGAEYTREAARKLKGWEKPAFVLFADSDPITRGNRDPLRELIPTASEQPDVWIEGAMHFLQEDAGEEIAERIVEFVDRT
jgi:haloalkane dehalogenase